MLTKTTISAIRALVYLGVGGGTDPVSPKRLAQQLGESPSYLAKVMRLLVKAGILRAHYGATGGVVLQRSLETISLFDITEACQGEILANLCAETDDLARACAFHQAGAELHQTIIGVMSRWTLADFVRNPGPSPHCDEQIRCWMRPEPQVGKAHTRTPQKWKKKTARESGRSEPPRR